MRSHAVWPRWAAPRGGLSRAQTTPGMKAPSVLAANHPAHNADRPIIDDTLTHLHWHPRRAAEQLGVSYKTLLNKIKECGISRR